MPSRKRQKTTSPVTAIPQKQDPSVEKLEVWKYRIARAKKIRKDWETTYKVEKCEKYLLGQQNPTARDKDIVLNHTLSTAKVIKPNVFYDNPKFFVKSKPGQTSQSTENVSAIGESILESIGQQDDNLVNAGGLAVWQNFTRIGVLKIVYDPTLVPNPNAGQPIYQTDEEGEPLLDEMKMPLPERNPLTGEVIIEPDEIVKDDLYRYEWVDAAKMLLPDDGPDQSKWTWIGEEIETSLEDAKDNTKFKKDLRSRLTANVTSDKPSSYYGYGSSILSPPMERFRYCLCYDMKKRRMYAYAEAQDFDEFLMDKELDDGVEDHPYAVLQGWTPILGPELSPWPLPFIHPWLDMQYEYNVRRQQVMQGAKRSSRKGVYDESTFPDADEAVKLLQNPDDMVFAKVNSVSRPPVMLEAPDINPSIYRDIQMWFIDWRLITGQTGSKLGDPDADTATEATFVERASNLRDTDMLAAVNRWLSTAGRKMLQLVKATLTMDVWIKIRGFSDEEFKKYLERIYQIPQEIVEFFPGLKEIFRERFGKEKPIRVTREQLQFEATVTVVPGSYRPHNLDVERQQWLAFLNVIGQFPQLALSRELLRETAGKFEYISERMLDELAALAQKMIEVNANQAGRGQGGTNGGGEMGASQTLAGMMSKMGGR